MPPVVPEHTSTLLSFSTMILEEADGSKRAGGGDGDCVIEMKKAGPKARLMLCKRTRTRSARGMKVGTAVSRQQWQDHPGRQN